MPRTIWRPTPLDLVLSNIRLPAKKIIAIIDIGKNSFAYINESIFCRSSSERNVFLKDNKEYKEEFSKVLLDRKKEVGKSKIFWVVVSVIYNSPFSKLPSK